MNNPRLIKREEISATTTQRKQSASPAKPAPAAVVKGWVAKKQQQAAISNPRKAWADLWK